jgi:hypothetical protein
MTTDIACHVKDLVPSIESPATTTCGSASSREQKGKSIRVVSILEVAERLSHVRRSLMYKSAGVFAKQKLSGIDQNLCNIFQVSMTHQGEVHA